MTNIVFVRDRVGADCRVPALDHAINRSHAIIRAVSDRLPRNHLVMAWRTDPITGRLVPHWHKEAASDHEGGNHEDPLSWIVRRISPRPGRRLLRA